MGALYSKEDREKSNDKAKLKKDADIASKDDLMSTGKVLDGWYWVSATEEDCYRAIGRNLMDIGIFSALQFASFAVDIFPYNMFGFWGEFNSDI